MPEAALDTSDLVALRRDLHAHPEVSFQETRTADVVARTLERLGIEVHRGVGRTGVVGVVRKGRSDRAVGLRADMDALPIQEANTFPHASRNPGVMHACGHDGHTAILLAAARRLVADETLDGAVYLLFQAAEEIGQGARAMLDDGLLGRFPMETVFAFHNWPGLSVGTFGVSPGPVMAACNHFEIVIHGRGGHAALPHLATDPVVIAFQLGAALQTIVSRDVPAHEAAVLSVTELRAGDALNILPDSCVMRGTVRCFSTPLQELIAERMRTLAQGIGAAFGARCEVDFVNDCPPTINDEATAAFAARELSVLVGAEAVSRFEPAMTAEDFSFLLRAQPGCFIALGAGDGDHRAQGRGEGPCQLHNPSYDFNDALIPLGAAAFARLAQRWLSQPNAAGGAVT